MRNRGFRYMLKLSFLCSLICITSCDFFWGSSIPFVTELLEVDDSDVFDLFEDGDEEGLFDVNESPLEISLVDVVVNDHLAYPLFQFTCGQAEDPGSDENCPEPEGFGCDGKHYHGTARPIGTVAADLLEIPNTIYDPFGDADDPDQCHCGWGKKATTITILQNDLVLYADFIGLPNADGVVSGTDMRIGAYLRVDPCAN